MKTKIFYITGISMLVALVAYIFLGLSILDFYQPWRYDVMWTVFYAYSAIAILAFLLTAAFKTYDIIKNINGSRMDSLSGVLGGLGSAFLMFGIDFLWFAVNHPTMNAPFASVAVAHFVYISYAIITVLMLISAVVLKIIAAVKESTE